MICKKCGTVQMINNSSSYCLSCGSPLKISTPKISTESWENYEKKGLIECFIKTAGKVLFKPTEFYSHFTNKSSLFPAVLFALISVSLGTAADLLWQHFLSINTFYSAMQISKTASTVIAFTPLVMFIHTALFALYIQGIMRFTKKNRYNLMTTFKALCYTNAASLFSIVPFFGPLLIFLWSITLILILVSKLNRISLLRSFFSLIIPALILILLVIIPLILIAGGLLFSAGSILKFYNDSADIY